MDSALMKYRAFLTAARLGSFTRAAEALGYSQSGISRMIADLEREWSVKLLERDRGGVRLTSDGHELVPSVQAVVDEHGRLQARIDSMSGLETGLIRIAAVTSVTTHWLPSIIKRFRADYPNIDYEITTRGYSEVERMITEGQVDCGFVRLPTKPSFDTIYLGRDELKVVMAADHPMAGVDYFPVRALGEYPFMTIDKQGDSDIAAMLDRYDIRIQSSMTTWDDYAVFAMVEKGLGISVQPALILRRLPFNIVAKSFDEPQYRELALAMRNRNTVPLATHRFIDYLRYRNEE
ncbi:MAG: LysR family transcriptional regulator [Eggerthellaceae bacterium]|nr:LysR family transcriptional regulator [Eggerthellaceae bacterium]